MSNNVCPQCGAPVAAGETECKYCGEKIVVQPAAPQQPQQMNPQQPYPAQPYPQQQYPQQTYPQQPYVQNVYMNPGMMNNGINPAWPIKNKIVAGVLALFLGGIGVHKFYLGQAGMGVLYLLFCWTGIPAIVAFIEAIIYFTSNDHNFQVKNHVRLE